MVAALRPTLFPPEGNSQLLHLVFKPIYPAPSPNRAYKTVNSHRPDLYRSHFTRRDSINYFISLQITRKKSHYLVPSQLRSYLPVVADKERAKRAVCLAGNYTVAITRRIARRNEPSVPQRPGAPI